MKYSAYCGKIFIGVFGGENIGIKPTHNEVKELSALGGTMSKPRMKFTV